jgi:beta-glucosidase-like glycosyl hydrolase
MIDVQGTTLTEEDRDLLQHPLVGAVILFTRNFESIEQLELLVADIRAARTPPLLVTSITKAGVQRSARTTVPRRCAPSVANTISTRPADSWRGVRLADGGRAAPWPST